MLCMATNMQAQQQNSVTSGLEVLDTRTGERRIVREFDHLIEAPNWTRDGRWIYFNSGGLIYKINAKGKGEVRLVDTQPVNKCNNDHVLSFDGKWLAVSGADDSTSGWGSYVYVLPVDGGTPRQVTPKSPSYLHGWSPDGKTLAYCAFRDNEKGADIYTIPATGGEETQLTDAPGLDDGPEYSPDGRHIWFNSVRTGLMQVWRMKADGSEQTQMTFDTTRNAWFPHVSPDGKQVIYITYHVGDLEPGEHLAGKNVELWMMPSEGGTPRLMVQLFGGQGTINTNSWAPDSRHVAFVSYRLGSSPADILKTNPRKAYGTDYPYEFTTEKLTKAPKGYKPFYISHYGRHGSRYYWNALLYRDLDSLLTTAHSRKQLTAEGEAFYKRFEAAKDELSTGVSELTDLGWEQHQRIARTMYNSFPEVFKKGGNVLAISSLTGRCVLSMSGFCQELVQCNPKIEIREQSSRFTLDGVVPVDRLNPVKHDFPKPRPRFEKNISQFKDNDNLREKVISRTFSSTEGLPGDMKEIGDNLINLYTSLPNIGHEGMMGNLVSDAEIAARWESANLGAYSWLFPEQYTMIPILQDIIRKADAVLDGSSDHIADLRFGHDNCLGPLHILMGINDADKDPENPYEVKNCYQNWETCKASNLQLIFYRSKKNDDDVLVKCLLNGKEATLPIPTDSYPYYKWSDFRQFYTARCSGIDRAQ
jgi:Tol biopolymer transport system component